MPKSNINTLNFVWIKTPDTKYFKRDSQKKERRI